MSSWRNTLVVRRPGSPSVRKVLAILKDVEIRWPFPAEDTVVQRLYVGRHQRSAGAWVWALEPADKTSAPHVWPSIGGCQSIRSLRRGYVSLYINGFNDCELVGEMHPQ